MPLRLLFENVHALIGSSFPTWAVFMFFGYCVLENRAPSLLRRLSLLACSCVTSSLSKASPANKCETLTCQIFVFLSTKMASNSASSSSELVLTPLNPSPSRPLLYKPFNFLKSLSLSSIGQGLDCIPSHVGRELVCLQRATPATTTGEKRKRFKVVANRTRTRPQSRSLPSLPKPPKFSSPSRKSARLAFHSSPSPSKSSDPIIQEISSSSSEGFSDSDSENTSFKQGRPVFFDIREEYGPQTTTKPSVQTSSTPIIPRKPRTAPPPKATGSVPLPKRQKVSPPSPLTDRHAQLLKRNVVRGKVINKGFFEEQGLGVFLNKLRAQGWLDLFANTQLGCSVPELAEFYANCTVTEGVVTSSVSGQGIKFDAPKLGMILGVPSHGFSVYVREDKTALAPTRLLEVSKRLSQKQGLRTPISVKKGDMTSLHQLLFMFTIKNIIPRGQGRNSADALDQCLVDLLFREDQINLPVLMIRHIRRIANTTRTHDLGYGFLLTRVFEHFGIVLTRRIAAQTVDEIGVDTLLGCGYEFAAGSASKQGRRPPRPPVSGQPSNQVEAVLEDNARLKDELSAVKAAFAEEQARSAKRHEDLLTLLSTLAPSIPPLQTKPPPAP